MKHDEPRPISAYRFDQGELSMVVEVPRSAFRMHERRESAFALSKEQGRQLALELLAWSVDVSNAAE
jgi:hypothetical protein